MVSKDKLRHLLSGSHSDSIKIYKKRNNRGYLVSSLILYACGSSTSQELSSNEIKDEEAEIKDEEVEIKDEEVEIKDEEVSDIFSSLLITLEENKDYTSSGHQNEILSADYNIFKTLDRVEDEDTSDNDQLIVTANQDILLVPKVSGFEKIILQMGDDFTENDTIFYVDLSNFSYFEQIILSNENLNSSVDHLLDNSYGLILVNSSFNEITAKIATASNLELLTTSDAIIKINGDGENISLNGNGNSIDITTTNLGNIDILENNSVTLIAPYAT